MVGSRLITALAASIWAAGVAPIFAQSAARPSPGPGVSACRLSALFEGVSILYGVDPGLLSAIARVESGYRPDAVSSAGAEGLMQLMPETASRYGVADAFDPAQNAIGAARFLAQLKASRLGEPGTAASLPEILAAYNAGPGTVRKYGGIPPYCETQAYVRRVLWLYLTGYVPQAVEGAACAGRVPHYGRHVRPKRGSTVLDDLAQLRRERTKLIVRGRR